MPKQKFSKRKRLMKTLHKIKFLVVTLLLLIQFVFIPPPKAYAATTTVNLGTADPFAVLAGTPNITDVPTSVITGNVGLDPAGGAGITGLKCSEVTGIIYDNDGGYTGNGGGTACRVTNAGLLTTAKND
ncbi:MAG TPA: hypothetical protein VLF68_04115, partial [Candidatus Saccharimonadales bacterium]|nr:hypothetical protein [Candidatus Saccharimonadales bacterium]